MDSSRYKRRERQIRPKQQTDLGESAAVPRSSPPLVDTIIPVKSIAHQVEVTTAPLVAYSHGALVAEDQNRPAARVNSTPLPDSTHDANSELPEPRRSVTPLDMGLPGAESPSLRKETVVKLPKMRRLVLRSSAIVAVFALAVGGFLFSQGYLKIHHVFKGSAVTAASLTANVNPELLKGEGDGRINVLLLGRGGGDHEAPDLTDTILLASIDPVNHTSTLLSIPRDLWVDVPNQGAMKINAVWETGEFKQLGKVHPGSTDPKAIQAGFDLTDQMVESILGVPINYNVLVDFQAFKQGVDTVDGVTVNVPTDLVDPTMAWENSNDPVLAKAGVQTFDGKHALIYVRSRETTSDFARSQRQRAVLVALKDKIDTLGTLSNPLKISGLMNAFSNNVKTDFSLKDASRFYSIVKQIGDSKVASVGFADGTNHYITTSNMNGQSVDVPTAGLFDYSDIQKFVRGQLKDGYIVKENAKVLVLNGTTTDGAATTVADDLKSYGYNVVGVGKAPTGDYNQTELINLSGTRDKYTAHYLEQRFNTTALFKLPDTSIQTNSADFVIIVGSDEATSQ